MNKVSSVPTIRVGPPLNLTKQRPVGCPIGLTNFNKTENVNANVNVSVYINKMLMLILLAPPPL